MFVGREEQFKQLKDLWRINFGTNRSDLPVPNLVLPGSESNPCATSASKQSA